MPELPEVETVARQLASRLNGRTVQRLTLRDPKLRGARRTPTVRGRTVERVFRHGKQVAFDFGAGRGKKPRYLLVHLRMTGRLIFDPEPVARTHVRARFDLDRGRLLFVDPRRFGTFAWYGSLDEAPQAVDPVGPEFTAERLAQLLQGSRQEVKVWLLRQDRLVGLGNIYASEILFAARLSPFKRVDRLTRDEIARLHRATRRILVRAIDSCGTTFSDFQDARGVEGSYQDFLKVYAREGKPCRRCRIPIERRVQQQRSTFYCPACQ